MNALNIKTLSEVNVEKKPIPTKKLLAGIKNGLLVCNGSLMTGLRHYVSWWRGNIRPFALGKATPQDFSMAQAARKMFHPYLHP